jgi:hypothetical protein
MSDTNLLQRSLGRSLAIASAIALILASTTAGATKKQQQSFLENPEGIRISRAELRVRVRALALPFSGIIEEAADSIIVETTDPEVRRVVLRWKINGIPSMQAALFQARPLAALLDAWALTIQTRESVESGPASELSDKSEAIILQALNQMEMELVAIAKLLGPTEVVEELRSDVEAWAAANPIDASLATRNPTTGELARLTADNKVGIRRTVAAANETMGDLATRMDVYTAFLPKQARWQAEYLTAQMVAGEDVGSVLQEFIELSNAIERMTETVNLAPELIAAERAAVLEALQTERIAALESIDRALVTALEYLTRERVEVFSTHLQEERVAIVAAIEKERTIALEALREERVAALDQVGVMTEEVVAESLKGIVDHFFVRLAQLGLVVLLIVGIALWALRRK